MNGTATPSTGRSVQLAVMAAPTTSIVHAVAEARRRQDAPASWIAASADGRIRQLVPASA